MSLCILSGQGRQCDICPDVCVLKVPAAFVFLSRVVPCMSLNVLTSLTPIQKTEAWHTPMECSCCDVNMYQYI